MLYPSELQAHMFSCCVPGKHNIHVLLAATPARLELATPSFGSWCSIHLSYGALLVVGTAGFEPAATSASGRHSSAELRARLTTSPSLTGRTYHRTDVQVKASVRVRAPVQSWRGHTRR